VVEDSANNLIGTYDNLTGINSNFVAFTNEQEIQTATAGQTVFTLTTTQYQPGTNSLSVFVDGVNQYGPGAQYAYVETDSTTVTFVSGLHVGASVKFTTSQLNSGGATNAALVSYDPPFTGSVSTNVQAKLAQNVSALDFGVDNSGAIDASTAIATAITGAVGEVLNFPPGTYLLNSPITITQNSTYLNFESGAILQYTGTDAALKFNGASYCRVTGGVSISCTNSSGSGVKFEATVSNNCVYNYLEFNTIANTQGRGSAPDVYTGDGIYFGPEVSGHVNYYHQVLGFRVADYNNCVVFDAVNGSPGLGSNANNVSILNMDNYWKGYKFRAIESTVRDTFFTGSAGDVTNSTYSLYFENLTSGNQAVNLSGEPGAYAIPYYIDTDANSNYISGALWNYGGASPTNLGNANLIINGRIFTEASVSTSGLAENTRYKFGRVRVLNNRGGIFTVNWQSRNTTAGYYSSGTATFFVWNQGGAATIMMVTSEAAHSDFVASTYTALVGGDVSGQNIDLVFGVRTFGTADNNTDLEFQVKTSDSCEFSQNGPTIQTGGYTYPITDRQVSRILSPVQFVTSAGNILTSTAISQSLANAGSVQLVNANAGFGFISTDAETMFFNTTAAGVVTKISGTTNTAATNTPGSLCVANGGGATVVIINNLGSTKTVFGMFYAV
jgi:hypothetical protein